MRQLTVNISDELGVFLGIYHHMQLVPNVGDEILYNNKLYKVIKRRFNPIQNELNIIVDSSHITNII